MAYNNNQKQYNNNRYNRNNNDISIKFIFAEKGYRDEKNNIRKDLILNEAENIAENFANAKLTRSQLRAFYGEVKSIENKITNQENFESNLYSILLLKAKVAYKFGSSGTNKIPPIFKEFIEKSVDLLEKENSYTSFKDFTIFFEAIVGYFYSFQNK